ncbi:glycosyltransferase family 4 protein [bacterium]|nr:glycosyltransferase family 4 protein [bacterium]
MKIAVVSHDTFWPLRGGGGIRVYWVTKRMIERNHNISVIAPFLSTDNIDRDFTSIDIRDLGRITRFVRFKEIAYMFLMVKIFFKLLFMKFDIIYAHNVVAGFPSLLVARLKGKPIVFDMDDILTCHSPNKLVNFLGKGLDYLTAKYSDITIVMSKSLGEKLKSKNIRNIELIFHGVDLTIFKPQREKKEFIIYAGGIERDDGVLLVPEAAEKVLKKFPQVKFLFIGEGRDLVNLKRRVIERKLQNNFIFKGWVDHRDIPYYLSRSKIGLVTNLRTIATEIAASLRVFEYMALELPVIIPDLNGMLEQVGNGSRGLIFKCEDANDLADKMLMLLDNETLRERLGKKGREYVVKNCDWRKNAKRIVRLCENCRNN